MRIRCPRCQGSAILTPDYTWVECTVCDYKASYAEYLDYLIRRDSGVSE